MYVEGYPSAIYLEKEGILHKKEASEKILIALMENHYRTDSEFKRQMEELEVEMEDCM